MYLGKISCHIKDNNLYFFVLWQFQILDDLLLPTTANCPQTQMLHRSNRPVTPRSYALLLIFIHSHNTTD